MTALSNLLNKDQTAGESEGELDIASLAPTVATMDSVKQKKHSTRGSKKGSKRNEESLSNLRASGTSLGASLSDVLEKFSDSNGSLGSDPDEMTCVTTDSREHSSSSLMRKSKRGGRKKGHKHGDSDDERAVHRERTIMMVD